MKVNWSIQFVFASLMILALVSFASTGTTVNAQATAAATSAGAPPASKMRWDIISVTTKDNAPVLSAGGVAAASANDGSYIVYTGSGTFGPGVADPVTGGGDWSTFDSGNRPTGNGKYTVTAFAGFDWAPGGPPPPLVDNIGKKADVSGGVATLRIAYSNADGSAAGMGTLIVSCHQPAGAPDAVVEGVIGSKDYTLFYNPVRVVGGVDQGRTQFHFVH